MVLRKSFYIRWSAGRSPRVHEVNPGRDPSPKGFDSDFLHINLHSTEKVMSLEQNGIKQRDKEEEKEFHQETSEEGLVLKELPSHLKYAYLELPKSKPVIISARLSDAEE